MAANESDDQANAERDLEHAIEEHGDAIAASLATLARSSALNDIVIWIVDGRDRRWHDFFRSAMPDVVAEYENRLDDSAATPSGAFVFGTTRPRARELVEQFSRDIADRLREPPEAVDGVYVIGQLSGFVLSKVIRFVRGVQTGSA